MALLTDPYIFSSLQAPGITASRRVGESSGVFGVDLALERLQDLVEAEKPSAQGGIVLLDGQGRLLAATSVLQPLLGADLPLLAPLDGKDIPLLDGARWIGGTEYLGFRSSWTDGHGQTIRIIVAAPLEDFTGYLGWLQASILIFAAALLTIMVPTVLLVCRKLTSILSSLSSDADRVRDLDFSGESARGSRILEFHVLAEGFHQMKETLSNRTEALDAALQRLQKIVELGIAMGVERDINRLTELSLQGGKELAHADGGSLYLKGPDDTLAFQIVLNDSLGFAQGGTSEEPISLRPVELYSPDGTPNHHNVVTHAFHTGQTIAIEDAYHASGYDFSGTRVFDEKNGYQSHSFLTVPLRPRGGEVIGALQLINALDGTSGQIIGFSPEIQRFVEALAAVAATAIHNRELLETQQRVFESMVQFTAGAIDAKSHYTGAHCARVPELAMMLAREAAEVRVGPLAAFGFAAEEEWREFQIGAWLHDCGKVTTPEFVVDKATKLETIYNRIHEIRTRFEVLLRDARIEALEAQLGGADPARVQESLTHRERQLRDDFAFLAACNSGEEPMSPEQLQRVRSLAAQTWIRHFDDRLGLSWEEMHRYQAVEARRLPCDENLLADKPEHVLPRREDFYRRYEGYGFALPVPQHLYNMGELYNLCIPRGTLNEEERFKVNEHIMQTIVMLERLPLPSNLRRVPDYAGMHHEMLGGTGYPRRLGGSELSVPARIMVIADIFEALTASDRPYKRPKKLSECVRILHGFRRKGEVDPDLFDLFLRSGTYRRYAEAHLRPEQIDEVDLTEYLGAAAAS